MFIHLYEAQCVKMSWSNIKKSKSQKKKLAKLSSSQCTVGNVVCKIPKMAICLPKNCHFSGYKPYTLKISALCFYLLLKLKKKKWTYLWNCDFWAEIWPFCQKGAIFDQKMAILWPHLEFAWACPWFNQAEIWPK